LIRRLFGWRNRSGEADENGSGERTETATKTEGSAVPACEAVGAEKPTTSQQKPKNVEAA
jgi:hypothetical protein